MLSGVLCLDAFKYRGVGVGSGKGPRLIVPTLFVFISLRPLLGDDDLGFNKGKLSNESTKEPIQEGTEEELVGLAPELLLELMLELLFALVLELMLELVLGFCTEPVSIEVPVLKGDGVADLPKLDEEPVESGGDEVL